MENKTKTFNYKFEGQLNNELFQSAVQNDSEGDVAIAWGATRDQAERNGKMILEAFETYNETNLTPRQLLEQRDELLKACERAYVSIKPDRDTINNSILNAYSILKKAIEKATKQPV